MNKRAEGGKKTKRKNGKRKEKRPFPVRGGAGLFPDPTQPGSISLGGEGRRSLPPPSGRRRLGQLGCWPGIREIEWEHHKEEVFFPFPFPPFSGTVQNVPLGHGSCAAFFSLPLLALSEGRKMIRRDDRTRGIEGPLSSAFYAPLIAGPTVSAKAASMRTFFFPPPPSPSPPSGARHSEACRNVTIFPFFFFFFLRLPPNWFCPL